MKKTNELSVSTTRTYSSLYFNPLNHPTHCRSYSSDYVPKPHFEFQDHHPDKENQDANATMPKPFRSLSTDRIFKPSSLQFCMQMNHLQTSLNIWDYSDSESAPASSWSTLPNKYLICRPLPLDVGRCTCFILKEPTPHGISGGNFFSLYTNEGQGRQNRKLAVALHKRRNGRSYFTIAQNVKGLLSHSDDTFLGTVTANLIGSKYHIWDQAYRHNSRAKQSKPPLAVVTYIPTITTCTGSHRSMRAYVPKHQYMPLKNTTQVQHIKGLPMNWEGKLDKVHQLFSKAPLYNKISKQYELDFRDKGKAGLKIQKSVKNFQLTLEENGSQTILQLGRAGKSKFVMDYSNYIFLCASAIPQVPFDRLPGVFHVLGFHGCKALLHSVMGNFSHEKLGSISELLGKQTLVNRWCRFPKEVEYFAGFVAFGVSKIQLEDKDTKSSNPATKDSNV